MSTLHVDIKKKLKEFDLNVSFTIHSGTCLGILGPSGCGKSMTLKSIAGIITPDEGTIELKEPKKVLYCSQKKIDVKPQGRNVGYLFQNYALFPNMTVSENIAIGIKHTDKEAIVESMIERFSLKGLENRYPRQLSGGQQQRVALARILAYNPDVILLDEPFSAMDSFLKENLRLQLAKVLKEYTGIVILVTHDRDEAFQLCDELVLMDKGTVIAHDTCEKVFENPGTLLAARLTGCKNISRAIKVDDTHVIAKDWDSLLLEVPYVEDHITHVGIRAHDLIPINHPESTNTFDTAKYTYEITEMPFEWYVVFSNGLWWKKGKEMHMHNPSQVIPPYFHIDPKAILLLKDTNQN